MSYPREAEKIAVYSPDGDKEVHTKANARDLVVGAGYSWQPNLPSQPAAFAPFRASKAGRASQDVLDSIGNQDRVMAPAPPEPEVEDDEPEAQVEPVAEADEPAAGGRRGRRPRTEAE